MRKRHPQLHATVPVWLVLYGTARTIVAAPSKKAAEEWARGHLAPTEPDRVRRSQFTVVPAIQADLDDVRDSPQRTPPWLNAAAPLTPEPPANDPQLDLTGT